MFLLRKLLTVALVLAVVSAASAFQGAEPKAADDDEARWLVNDAEFIFKINVRQLLGSGLMKGKTDDIKNAIKMNRELSNMIDATGLDVTKDVDLIVMSASGNSKADMKAYVVIKGKFDLDKVHTALKKREEVRPVKEGAIQLYEFSVQDQTLVGAFPDNKTMVLTSSKDTTVDLVKGTKKSAVSKPMKAATAKFNGRESMTFALVVNEEMKKQLENAPRFGEAASKLQSITAALTVTDAITFNVTGVTNDPKASKQLAALLETGKAAGKAGIAGNDDIPAAVSDLLDAIKIAGGKDGVTVDLKIAKETLDKLKKGGGGNR